VASVAAAWEPDRPVRDPGQGQQCPETECHEPDGYLRALGSEAPRLPDAEGEAREHEQRRGVGHGGRSDVTVTGGLTSSPTIVDRAITRRRDSDAVGVERAITRARRLRGCSFLAAAVGTWRVRICNDATTAATPSVRVCLMTIR